jgi:hypothetical protein
MAKSHDPKILAALATIFALPSIEEMIKPACGLAAPKAHPDIRERFRCWDADPRSAMSRKDCQNEGGWGETTQITKEDSGDLFSFLDGKKRLISTSSFHRHLITRLILACPADGSTPKGTATSTRFKAAERNSEATAS